MESIISPPTAAQKSIKTRARRLVIDNPVVGDIHIRYEGEKLLLLDGEPVAPMPCENVSRNLMGVATEVKTITDPVTGQEVTLSVAGAADYIVKCFCDWYREDDAARAAAIEAARVAAEAEVARQAAEAEAARIAAEEAAARQAAEAEAARLAAEAEAAAAAAAEAARLEEAAQRAAEAAAGNP